MKKNNIIIFVFIIIIVLVYVFGFRGNSINLPEEQGKIWVSKHTTQCAEEWQPWVYERNKNVYRNDDSWEENQAKNLILENEGIKEFYKKNQGITIYDVKRKNVKGESCTSCNCLSYIELFLQVADKDVDKMLGLFYIK